MLRRALSLLVLVVLCAGSMGCNLLSLVAKTESSEGRSDEGASDVSGSASDSDGNRDEDDQEDDEDDDDGWDDEDDDD